MIGPCRLCVYKQVFHNAYRQEVWKCQRFPPVYTGRVGYYQDSLGQYMNWDFPEVQPNHGCGEYKADKKKE